MSTHEVPSLANVGRSSPASPPLASFSDQRQFEPVSLLWLVLGAVALTFVGWRYNVPLAAWIMPVFLVRFYRDQRRWYTTLIAIPLLTVASYLQLAGAWDLDPWQLYLLPLLRPAIIVVALYFDRALANRLPKWAATLVFPSIYLSLDYVFSFTPFGTVLSVAPTQFGSPMIAQLASLTGIWGIGFLINWTAAVMNLVWERRTRLRKAGPTPIVFVAIVLTVFVYGSVRAALLRPTAPTVRVASVTVAHPRDYWNWIDAATPPGPVGEYADELRGIEDLLFAQSEKAVTAGAKIVFWSEGNAVIRPEERAAFSERASQFARDHGVYLAASVLELHYGSTVSDNKVEMFTPSGKRVFTYVKTMSWYPTGSEGTLRTVDTPYGRLATAVCFDMDFPRFINTLGRAHSDIVLVPSYDSAGIRPFHTEVGMFRALENGFSMVRQTNEGTSMAVDGVGHILSRQEFFETSDPVMFADVPTRRVPTVYAALGDWFAYVGISLALGLLVIGFLFRTGGRSKSS